MLLCSSPSIYSYYFAWLGLGLNLRFRELEALVDSGNCILFKSMVSIPCYVLYSGLDFDKLQYYRLIPKYCSIWESCWWTIMVGLYCCVGRQHGRTIMDVGR